MSNEKKFLRKCIACNEYKEKKSLIRILRNFKNGELHINPSNKVYGRSVYICPEDACIEGAFKKLKIAKILKCKVDADLKEKIKTVLEN